MIRSLDRRRQGFSLVELAVVIVIVGVLAAFGVPRYRDSVERTKAAEAFNYLSAVRSAQERHLALKGKYADDPATLDIKQELPKYFDPDLTPWMRTLGNPVTPPTWELVLTRKSDTSSYGAYTVKFTQAGFDGPGSTISPTINPIDTSP